MGAHKSFAKKVAMGPCLFMAPVFLRQCLALRHSLDNITLHLFSSRRLSDSLLISLSIRTLKFVVDAILLTPFAFHCTYVIRNLQCKINSTDGNSFFISFLSKSVIYVSTLPVPPLMLHLLHINLFVQVI